MEDCIRWLFPQTPTAIKQHQCDTCKKTIKIGDKYIIETGVIEETLYNGTVLKTYITKIQCIKCGGKNVRTN